MYSALIAASKGKAVFEELLNSDEFTHIVTVSNGEEARKHLLESSFDLVIINAPLSDEYGHKLALEITESTSSGVLLIAKEDIEQAVCKRVEDYGVFVVPKPLNRQIFFRAVKLVIAFRRRALGLSKENDKLQKKIEEIRLVDRAKCTLIQYLNMTEEQAHHYIERQAMDMRITKREVAEGILKTYET
ncbi:MAG: ANTAR domain-containing protein [Clostridiales bacterium]|nr:ANTAR domain-containing protein [Clostridiales bacterium]